MDQPVTVDAEKLEKIWNVITRRGTHEHDRPAYQIVGHTVSKMLTGPCTYAEAQRWRATGEGWEVGAITFRTYAIVKHLEALAAVANWQGAVNQAQQELRLHA